MTQADLSLNLTTKRTRKREFLVEMERVVPWAALVGLITPYAAEDKRQFGHNPVRTVQFVDSAGASDRSAGMSARANGQQAWK